MSERTRYDIALVVALPEEFRALYRALNAELVEQIDGDYYYEAQLGPYRALVFQIGNMGLLMATLAVTRLLGHFEASAIILLGIAGRISEDVRIGDVVVAEDIDHYMHAVRISDGADEDGSSLDVEFGGKSFPVARVLVQLVANFEFAAPRSFDAWQRTATDRITAAAERNGLSVPKYCALRPTVRWGPIASGEAVVAAQAFVGRLKERRNRKYLAVEMEAGGIALAAHAQGAGLLLVVRGISDLADGSKAATDSGSGDWPQGFWRQYALDNAVSFVKALVSSGRLQEVVPASDDHGGGPAAADSLDTAAVEQNVLVASEYRDKVVRNDLPEGDPVTALAQQLEKVVLAELGRAPGHRMLAQNLTTTVSNALDVDGAVVEYFVSELTGRRRIIERPPYLILPRDLWHNSGA